jgi:hypothetical protein
VNSAPQQRQTAASSSRCQGMRSLVAEGTCCPTEKLVPRLLPSGGASSCTSFVPAAACKRRCQGPGFVCKPREDWVADLHRQHMGKFLWQLHCSRGSRLHAAAPGSSLFPLALNYAYSTAVVQYHTQRSHSRAQNCVACRARQLVALHGSVAIAPSAYKATANAGPGNV